MFSKLLFGVQNSPQRKLCVGLSVILVLIGIAYIPVRSGTDGVQAVFTGLAFILLGLVAIAIVARLFAARDEKVATQEQLDRLPGEYDSGALQAMVDHTPHDPNDRLGRVTGQIDGDEIRATVEQVRGESGG